MQRSLPGAIWALLLVNFVGSLGFTITLPLMPYYAATFGADPFTVGLIASSYAVCALIAGPILGQLSDRQGRRPWLLFSQLGTVIGFVVTALGGSLWLLFLGLIGLGRAAELHRPLALYAVMAMVFSLFVASIGLFMQLRLQASPLTAGLLVAYYGVVSVVMQFVIVAPLVGGALIAAGTPGMPFVAGALVALAGLLVAWQGNRVQGTGYRVEAERSEGTAR